MSAASLSLSGAKHETAAKFIKNQYPIMSSYINSRAETSQQRNFFFLQQNEKKISKMNIKI